MHFRPKAHIDLTALAHNLRRVRELAPNRPVMAVIKADAYGHGGVQIATALSEFGAEILMVARFDEALALRASGIQTPITILEGVYSASELAEAVALQFDLVLHDAWQIQQLVSANIEATTAASPIKIWLKLETGMHRLGLMPHQAAELAQQLLSQPWCRELGLMTHMACADDTKSRTTELQLRRFTQFVEDTPLPAASSKSLANSACICAWPAAHGDWLRPGIMLYGSSPVRQQSANELDLLPVMSLQTRVVAVHDVAKGQSVGYGANWSAEKNSRIAIAAIGYADGYSRQLPSGTPVWVAGQLGSLAGRVSMDKIAINVTDHALDVLPGDEVELWGKRISIDDIANRAGTISYELLSGVGTRVERIFHSTPYLD